MNENKNASNIKIAIWVAIILEVLILCTLLGGLIMQHWFLILPTAQSIATSASGLTDTPPLTPAANLQLPCDIIYAVGWQGEGIYRVDMNQGKIIEQVKTNLYNNRYLAWNEVRKELYVASANGSDVLILETEPLQGIATISENVGWNADAMEVSPKGNAIYFTFSQGGSGKNYRRIVVLDPATKKSLHVVPLDNKWAPAYLKFSSNGEQLYVSWGSNLDIYNPLDMSLIQRNKDVTTESGRLVISRDGRYIYIVQPNELLKWEIQTQSIVTRIPLEGIKNGYSWIELSREGDMLWVAGDFRLHIVSTSSNETDFIRFASPTSIRESSDSSTLYISSDTDTLSAVDLKTRKKIKSMKVPGIIDFIVRPCTK